MLPNYAACATACCESWLCAAAVARVRGQPALVNNEICRNHGAGVQLRSGACPRVEGNTLRDGKSAGLSICDGACGVVRGNVLSGHLMAGVHLCDLGTAPLLEDNNIGTGQAEGVRVSSGAGSLMRGNEIHSNAMANVRAHPTPPLPISPHPIPRPLTPSSATSAGSNLGGLDRATRGQRDPLGRRLRSGHMLRCHIDAL